MDFSKGTLDKENILTHITGNPYTPILVRGTGDVASAVAIGLLNAGYAVLMHDVPEPTAPRRGMAFTDAVFDGVAILEGIEARRIELTMVDTQLANRQALLVSTAPFEDTLAAVAWAGLVDARLRKRATPEIQRGLAPVTIGIGPNFSAGENVDYAIESSWGERLGCIVDAGSTLPLAGEPRTLGGVGRERFIYAPIAGRFRTQLHIGDAVTQGEPVAAIGEIVLAAPLAGIVRGLTHDGVTVPEKTKVLEVDPRGDPSSAFGLGERPKRIADGVLHALSMALERI